jgi:hypothetical protein
MYWVSDVVVLGSYFSRLQTEEHTETVLEPVKTVVLKI